MAGEGEIILKIEGATLCGTDLRIISGEKTSGVNYGSIMGHEFGGRIHQIGSGVSGFEVGQQATCSIVVSCNQCRPCLLGMEHMCERLVMMGSGMDGGLADYLRIPANVVAAGSVVTTSTDLDPTHLALSEPLSCCLNGFDQYGVHPGDTVVILGAGAIGLLHTQLARLAGAHHIVVSNRSAPRRELALQVGATHAVSPDELDDTVRDLTGGFGADAVVQCIGNLDLANQALQLARVGGRVNYFAGFPKGTTAAIDVNLIHYNELKVTGGSNAHRAQVHRAVRLLESGAVQGDAIVSHVFGLDQLDDALAAAANKDGVKIALRP